jgi:hypothetical protein
MGKNISEPLVVGVLKSDNRKIGNVATTYASQASCPKSCPFFNNGCYAESGFTGFTTRRLNKATTDFTTEQDVANSEASVIDRMSGKLPLRLHVVGDCATPEAAATVSAAAGRYIERGGQKVWTYTHAWRKVNRKHWGKVSVLASTESVHGIRMARKRGYAAAIVVESHPADGKAYTLDGEKIIPCPEQTRGLTCDQCRLCWNDESLKKRKATIAFAAHGQSEAKVVEKLHIAK